jgi:AcrR family transcriptional regulator
MVTKIMQTTETKTVRQQNIIDAARRVIHSKGIESLTTRQIAQELNLTNGALYRHFKSKKEIIDLLIEDTEKTLLATISQAAHTKGNSIERLESIFETHISYSERMKGTSFVIINEVSGIKDKELQMKTLGVINKYLETIKGIIIEGQKEGLIRDDVNPESASVVFLGTLQTLVTIWSLSAYEKSLRKDKLFDVIKAGLLK